MLRKNFWNCAYVYARIEQKGEEGENLRPETVLEKIFAGLLYLQKMNALLKK